MKVSVITISYNAVSVIEETIQSVLKQSYKDIEYIIIDGGSTDGTVDIIKKYQEKINYWVSEPDNGIYDAMNKGIDKATGEWINFMNAGDCFHSNQTLESFIPSIPKDTDIAYGNTLIMLSTGNILEKPLPLELITKRMVFGHQATLIKTNLHKKYKFDTSYKSSGDYNFFYQAYKNHCKFSYIPITVANYEGENGISIKNILTAKKENGRIQGKSNNLGWKIKYSIICCNYKIRQQLKKILPQKLIIYIKKKKLKNNE